MTTTGTWSRHDGNLETVWAPRVLTIVRIVSALIFMAHGTQKLLELPAVAPTTPSAPTVLALRLAGSLEIVGGILLLFGLFTRPVASSSSGQMAFAYWMGHAPRSFFPMLNGGDAAILYCFLFLYFAFAGGGAWSLDRAIRTTTLTALGLREPIVTRHSGRCLPAMADDSPAPESPPPPTSSPSGARRGRTNGSRGTTRSTPRSARSSSRPTRPRRPASSPTGKRPPRARSRS